LKKNGLSDIITSIMRVKILKNLAYLMVFFITLLPLPWSSYRLKTVSWPDLFVFAVILVEIYFYIRSYKKKTFKIKDLLLVVPLISIIMAFYSFVMIFTGSPDISFHSKTFLFFNISTYFLLAGTVSYFLWKQLGRLKQNKKQVVAFFEFPVFLFIIACLLSFVNAGDPERSIFMFKSILTGIIILYFIKELFMEDKNTLKGLGYSYVCGASITALLGFFQYFTGTPMGFIGNPGIHNFIGQNNEVYTRLVSTMQHPNLLAAALLPAVFINPALWISLKKKTAWLTGYHLISFLVLVFAVILTYSRAVWLGLLIGFIGLLIIVAWNNKKIIMVSAVVITALFLLFHVQILERLKGTTENDVNVVSRIEAWKSAILMFKDYPLTGIGLNNYYTTYEKYKTPAAPFIMEDAHNTFLNTAAELGLFGIAAFLWLLVVFFRKFFSPGKEVKVLLVGLLALLIAGCFENLWFDPRVIAVFWIFLAFIYGTEKVYSKK